MRAMQLEHPHQLLKPVEITERSPAAGQVRIVVSASGVCRTDLHVVDGELSDPKLPIVPGHEIIGRVTALGEGVTGLALDQCVGVPWLGWAWGTCTFCRRGQENLCPFARFTGDEIEGGFASKTIADARFVFALPDSYSDEHAAPLMCAGVIGWRTLKTAGDAPRIGLYGFGAAAHIVVQVANARGQMVFAFVRPGDEKATAFAHEMGAVGQAIPTGRRPSRWMPRSSMRRPASSFRRRYALFVQAEPSSAARFADHLLRQQAHDKGSRYRFPLAGPPDSVRHRVLAP